jgi:hypothetical protein
MRRLGVLTGLIAVAWFALQTGPTGTTENLAATLQTCCPTGTGNNPHLGCVGGTCQEIQGCGFDDCSACTACDPQQAQACINMGWNWDPITCTCSPPACDPTAEQSCLSQGGVWNPNTCTCSFPCNPGPPVLVGTVSSSYQSCVGGDVYDCEIVWYHYQQYCQDGTLYNEWTDEVSSCVGPSGYCNS